MTRSGDEMILELSTLLNKDVVKNAAKKEEKDDKEECKEYDKEKSEKKKKSSVMVDVLQDLVKLAGELDEIGADEASELVDNALGTIISDLNKQAMDFDDEVDTEIFEEDPTVTGREEGMGTRTEHTLQDEGQPHQDLTPEGLGMGDFSEHGTMEDKLDELFSNPEFRARIKDILG